ncbi:MAG: CvpA family protein [Verrucomicrobia bacterium]|nr:CvpA family protein [Verrucomicrobiota bacterium]
MNSPNLPFNWIDLVVVAALLAGALLGRKKGMSEELLPVFQWLAIVVVGALYYESFGKYLAEYTNLSLLPAYLVVYLGIVLGHILFFSWLKRIVGEKLVASDIFGRLEFYLGMAAGASRFACIVMVVFALLNARYISPEQLAADARLQRDNFGSISFPTFGLLQQAVFEGSFTGRTVKKYLNEQLIAATPPNQYLVKRESVTRRRERAVDEVMGR